MNVPVNGYVRDMIKIEINSWDNSKAWTILRSTRRGQSDNLSKG